MPHSIAIIGASKDRRKYGNKSVRAFVQGGWTVYPVNPHEKEIEGVPCYASITDVPTPLDRVAMYVPPEVGKRLLPDIVAKQPKDLFLNPGSADDGLVRRAKEMGLNAIEACCIVDLGLRPDQFPDE